ncbi:hypothetical protein HDV02_006363 [Globomyces sp. JEL0801]|nr:hypothetical protein HDV02_006363 [Globomyces sp. JEL0801]
MDVEAIKEWDEWRIVQEEILFLQLTHTSGSKLDTMLKRFQLIEENLKIALQKLICIDLELLNRHCNELQVVLESLKYSSTLQEITLCTPSVAIHDLLNTTKNLNAVNSTMNQLDGLFTIEDVDLSWTINVRHFSLTGESLTKAFLNLPSTLMSLSLCFSFIQDEDAAILEDYLARNHIIQSLKLVILGNNVDSYPVERILHSLCNHTSLKRLELKIDAISPISLNHLATILKSNQDLSVLSIVDSRITSFYKLKDVLVGHHSLDHLTLDYMSTHSNDLCHVLDKCRNLRKLELEATKVISIEPLMNILQILESNPTLEHVWIPKYSVAPRKRFELIRFYTQLNPMNPLFEVNIIPQRIEYLEILQNQTRRISSIFNYRWLILFPHVSFEVYNLILHECMSINDSNILANVLSDRNSIGLIASTKDFNQGELIRRCFRWLHMNKH